MDGIIMSPENRIKIQKNGHDESQRNAVRSAVKESEDCGSPAFLRGYAAFRIDR